MCLSVFYCSFSTVTVLSLSARIILTLLPASMGSSDSVMARQVAFID